MSRQLQALEAEVAIMLRRRPRQVVFALSAFLCMVGTQVVFWTFILPVNQQTK